MTDTIISMKTRKEWRENAKACLRINPSMIIYPDMLLLLDARDAAEEAQRLANRRYEESLAVYDEHIRRCARGPDA